jgi:hypothetical protein
MKKINLDVFERIVQTAERIREAQEKRLNDTGESNDKSLEQDV